MYVAREKFQSNIVEYVLYMFHIEDVIRANKLSIEELDKNVISKYNFLGDQYEEVRVWYLNLISRMRKEAIEETGHLASLLEIIFQLNDLHIELLNAQGEERYLEHYNWASQYIKELKEKMHDPELTEIAVCLNGLYGFMLLKIKGLDISEETAEAMSVFTQMLRYLSRKYHQKVKS
jgi:hypothetical protein